MEIYADNLELLGKKGDFQSDGNTGGGYGQQQQPASTPSTPQSQTTNSSPMEDEADDLPF